MPVSLLPQIKIKVEGSGNEIIFSNLVINQNLADVNTISFTWRQPEGEAKLSDHVNFYKKNLSKQITINIDDNFTFKGLIYSISCNNQDLLGVSYDIIGKGIFMKIDEVPECHSFYKQNLKAIFDNSNTSGGTMKLSPNSNKELLYTVMYNQTRFQFMRMMAARFGEWLYYNGTELILGDPSGEVISLTQEEDVYDIDFTAKVVKASHIIAGFDHYKGEVINGELKENVNGGGFMEASIKAGEAAFGTNHAVMHYSNAVTKEFLKDFSVLKQQAAAAMSVSVTARSHNSKLQLAGKIKILDTNGGDAGEYIITEIQHTCISDSNYQNHFVAIPAETKVPPYTNPQLFAICKPQPALVIDNEDKDGLDRIKVRFPWMPDDQSSPWLSVLTPHAGKGKGIRFLPEIGEEVLVGFVDNNVERPFVMGAVHTEQNKSGNEHKGNNLKIIGTKTGRRLEIDDDKGFILIRDFNNEDKGNSLRFENKDRTLINMSSGKDAQNFTSLQLIEGNLAAMVLFKGGSAVMEISLNKEGNNIKIATKGNISLNADGDITLGASNITLKATQNLKMEGTAGVEMKGTKIEIKSDTTMDVKGLNTTVEGSVMAELKSSAVASVSGSLVKIN